MISNLYPIWKNLISIRGLDIEPAEVRNCNMVEYNVHKGHYSINMRLGRYKENVPLFRWFCDHEDDGGYKNLWKELQKVWVRASVDPQGREPSDKFLKKLLRHLKTSGVGPKWKYDLDDVKSWGQMGRRISNAKTIHEVPDDIVEAMVRYINTEVPLSELDEKNDVDVQLMACGSCSKKESACGEFKRCNRCKQVFYCGRECQVEHWKSGHKKLCVEKKKQKK